jgi:hypothetical protein
MTALYAIVDTARDPALYDLVTRTPEHACLFGGRLEPPLERAAPYLVCSTPYNVLFDAWRNQGWGQSWGIWCRSSLSLSDLRWHFRQFLQARLPDGKIVLFRYYDPRVWRTYLPTCNAQELAEWFAGVEEYGVEMDGGRGTFVYRWQNGALNVSQA